MRISYCTWGMPEIEIERAIPAIAGIGYRGVELAVTPGFDTELYSLTASARRQIAELFREHQLVLSAVAGHTSMCEVGERDEANQRRLRDTIDLTSELAQEGEQAIMASLVGGRSEDWEGVREILAERVHALGDYAASRGVVVAVEPHSGNACDTPAKALWLMRAVDHPAVRLNFDISHFDILGMDVDECVAQMVSYSVHTHVKDQRGRYPDHEFLTPGSGPFDFVRYLQAMDQAGYAGFIGMEVSKMVQRKPGYDPLVDAALGYWALVHAFNESGAPLER